MTKLTNLNKAQSLILCLFLFISFNGFSQLQQPKRYEVRVEQEDDYYNVAPAGEDGVFLFRKQNRLFFGNQQSWEVVKLDTALNEVWKFSYALNNSLDYKRHYQKNGKFYILFSDFFQRSRNFTFLQIDVRTGKAFQYTITNFVPLALTQFKVTDRAILLGGYFNLQPLVIYFSFAEKKSKVLPGFFNERAELVELELNDDGTFDILLSGQSFDKRKTMFIKSFDPDGNLINNFSLDAERRRTLIFGKSIVSEDNQLIAGVYGRRGSEYSRGLFIANVNQYGEQAIKYYNYGDLTNFFGYLKIRREERIKRRIERRKTRNKRIKFNYRVAVHDIVKKDDHYVLIGEAFYPRYKNVGAGHYGGGIFNNARFNSPGGFGGNSASLLFDGYRFTHAVIIGFDEEGNLLWDNTFEINDVIKFDLEPNVALSVEDDQMVLLYLQDNAIRSKIIKDGEVVEGKEFNDIQMKFQDDVVKNNDFETGKVEHWYNNVHCAYGVQRIKNLKDKEVDLNRKVFFINKVVYN
ncbi:MAG: hypothetical protein AAFX87_11170 [Bacteroidota bacterium]